MKTVSLPEYQTVKTWTHGRNDFTSEILTAVLVKNPVFSDMMPCGLVDL